MPRLPARAFYGIIVAGLVTGMGLAAVLVWVHRTDQRGRAAGANDFDGLFAAVMGPLMYLVAVMLGATFGGLAGVAVAVLIEKRRPGQPRA